MLLICSAVANMTPYRPPHPTVNPLKALQAKPGIFQYQLYFHKEVLLHYASFCSFHLCIMTEIIDNLCWLLFFIGSSRKRVWIWLKEVIYLFPKICKRSGMKYSNLSFHLSAIWHLLFDGRLLTVCKLFHGSLLSIS